MSNIPFSRTKLNGSERKSIIEAVQTQLQEAALKAIKPLLTSFLEAELEAKLGRAKRATRAVSSTPRLLDWACGYCGCADANEFTRDGHYQRNLETG